MGGCRFDDECSGREKAWVPGGWWIVEGGTGEDPGETRVVGGTMAPVLWVRWS